MKAPAICPVCGEDVPSRALACPGCGADHNSGWREDASNVDALDLPDDEFDYDEFVREEFGTGRKRAAVRPVWWITALVLFLLLVALYLGRVW